MHVFAESFDDKGSPELGMKYDEPEAAVLLVACAIGLATGAAHSLPTAIPPMSPLVTSHHPDSAHCPH